MQRNAVVVIGIVVASGWLGMPPAAADEGPCAPGYPCNFMSPSGNIACSLAEAAPAGTQGSGALAYCEAKSPKLSVVMDKNGSVTSADCVQDSCTLNAGQDFPALAYGQTARHAMFTCVSEETGVTCTTPSGGGFTLSRSGVTTVG